MENIILNSLVSLVQIIITIVLYEYIVMMFKDKLWYLIINVKEFKNLMYLLMSTLGIQELKQFQTLRKISY